LGFRAQSSGFRVQGSGFGVWGSGCGVQGSGFRVQGSGFRVQGSGFRVQGVGLTPRSEPRSATTSVIGSLTAPALRIRVKCMSLGFGVYGLEFRVLAD
jgi:hypothetical protein